MDSEFFTSLRISQNCFYRICQALGPIIHIDLLLQTDGNDVAGVWINIMDLTAFLGFNLF